MKKSYVFFLCLTLTARGLFAEEDKKNTPLVEETTQGKIPSSDLLESDAAETVRSELEEAAKKLPVEKDKEASGEQVVFFEADGSFPSSPANLLPSQEDLEEIHPVIETPYKSPWLAAVFSSLIPGLGHAYLNDLGKAGGFFSATAAGAAYGILRYDEDKNNEIVLAESFLFVKNMQALSIYAAFRDARGFNGHDTYRYKMPVNTVGELAYAPFSPRVLLKPEVWGGVAGGLTLAVLAEMAYEAQSFCKTPTLSIDDSLSPPLAFLVGIGEEALFRGYLQSYLIEETSPALGIALASLTFGLAHIPNAQYFSDEDKIRYYTISIPLITTLGAYFGFLTYKNASLEEAVAIHSWYDCILFSIAYFSSGSSHEEASMFPHPKKVRFSISF